MRKSMLMFSALMLLLVPSMAIGSSNDIPVEPIPISPDQIHLSGSWNYQRDAGTVSGMCPAGSPAQGTMAISQQGSQVSIRIVSGSTCKPASVCQYSGSLDGNQLDATNAAVVDDEGGKVTNAMHLVISSNSLIRGASSSRYEHPKGFACAWKSQVTLSRTNAESSESSATGGTPSTDSSGTMTSGSSSGTGGMSTTGGSGSTAGEGTSTGASSSSGTGSTGAGGPPSTGSSGTTMSGGTSH